MLSKLFHRMVTAKPDSGVHLHPKEQSYLYGVDEFIHVLTRECARSDRSGHTFSLAVLHIPAGGGDHDVDALVALVGDRLRVTDLAGWLRGNEQLAILLYACSPEYAHDFVERIRSDGPFDALNYDIFAYPEVFLETLKANDEEASHA